MSHLGPSVPRATGEHLVGAGELAEAIAAITSAADAATALQLVLTHACRLSGARYGSLLVIDPRGRPTEVFHHGDGDGADASAFSELVGTPLEVRGQTLGLLYLGDRDDPASLADGGAGDALTALRSVAAYVLDRARSQAAADRRRVWHHHAAALAGTLQRPFDFAAADRAVTDVAMQAAGAVASTIARIVDDEMVVTATSGSAPDWRDGDAHETQVRAALARTTATAAAGDDHVVLLARLGTHLSPSGALAVYFPAAAPPADVETDLLAEFAEQAALALDRSRAFQEREQMALVSDRDRIARELHDAVIQRLFAAGLHLHKSFATAEDPQLRERLKLSMLDLDQTIRAIRDTVFDLRGEPRSSVASDLRDVVVDHVDELGFVPAVHTEGPVDQAVSRPAQQALLEVLRQALSNIARHARATSATIDVRVAEDHVALEVSDDGRGPRPDHAESSLATLRLALQSRGGTLELREGETAGTVLTCWIPLGRHLT